MDVHTEPHWDSAALVTIDVQRDFLDDGPWTIPGTTAVLPKLALLADAFRAAGRPIFHVVRLYPADGRDVDRVRRATVMSGAEFVSPGTKGRLLAADLSDTDFDDDLLLSGEPQQIGPAEYVIYKPRWGAFHRTRLDDLLTESAVDTVVVAGCNLPNCPRASIIGAHDRDYRVALVTDAVSQASDQDFREIAGLGTTLCTTSQVIKHV